MLKKVGNPASFTCWTPTVLECRHWVLGSVTVMQVRAVLAIGVIFYLVIIEIRGTRNETVECYFQYFAVLVFSKVLL